MFFAVLAALSESGLDAAPEQAANEKRTVASNRKQRAFFMVITSFTLIVLP